MFYNSQYKLHAGLAQWGGLCEKSICMTSSTRNTALAPVWIRFAPGLLILGWWLHDLQYQWSALVDYQYGYMVAMLAAYLVWERMPNRPLEDEPAPAWGVCLVFLGAPLVLFAELYKQGVAPTPMASFVLSIGCVLFLSALLLASFGRRTWRHFFFPLMFMFVAVPLPGSLWSPVVNTLRGGITTMDVEALKLLGVPAMQQGNVIRLPSCVVGVDEACSGVRSLQSSIMAALFIGDLVFRRTSSRVLFLGAGIVLALAGNFLRSLYLSLTAHRHGIEALHKIHDAAGWSILAFTAIGLILCAWGVTRLESSLATRVEELKTKPRLAANPPLDKSGGTPLV
jgi:exosortase